MMLPRRTETFCGCLPRRRYFRGVVPPRLFTVQQCREAQHRLAAGLVERRRRDATCSGAVPLALLQLGCLQAIHMARQSSPHSRSVCPTMVARYVGSLLSSLDGQSASKE